jgi:FeoB-associated Cys-rich membrane protein
MTQFSSNYKSALRSQLSVSVRNRTIIDQRNPNSYICIMFQQIILSLIFLGAAFYLGRMVYRSFQSNHACSSGCAKCGAADLEKIEKRIV